MVMIMVMIILQIDSNRMFSGFIGDCKIFQVYSKSKFHVQKYDSTFSFVVSFQCTSIKVVCTVMVKVFLMLSSTSYCCVLTPVEVWSNWLIDWLIDCPQKLFFTCLNQFNLGHASIQSCELPKRPILHIKIHKDWTVLHCTPTEEQNHRAGKKHAQTLLASIFDTLQFQPGSGCTTMQVWNHAL